MRTRARARAGRGGAQTRPRRDRDPQHATKSEIKLSAAVSVPLRGRESPARDGTGDCQECRPAPPLPALPPGPLTAWPGLPGAAARPGRVVRALSLGRKEKACRRSGRARSPPPLRRSEAPSARRRGRGGGISAAPQPGSEDGRPAVAGLWAPWGGGGLAHRDQSPGIHYCAGARAPARALEPPIPPPSSRERRARGRPGSVPAAELRAGRGGGVGGWGGVEWPRGRGQVTAHGGLEDPRRDDAGREPGTAAVGALRAASEAHPTPPPSTLPTPGLGAALTFRSLAHARTELAHKVAGGGGAALALLPAPSLPSPPSLSSLLQSRVRSPRLGSALRQVSRDSSPARAGDGGGGSGSRVVRTAELLVAMTTPPPGAVFTCLLRCPGPSSGEGKAGGLR